MPELTTPPSECATSRAETIKASDWSDNLYRGLVIASFLFCYRFAFALPLLCLCLSFVYSLSRLRLVSLYVRKM